MSPQFLEGLNERQLEAVTLPAQSALILAGAGSGKTRVLTTRIAWLIQTGQISPHGLLAVTFTNKAAKEMLTRITAMLPINTRGMWVGTFHGLCNRMLRAHYREAGLPNQFQIMDTQDQLALVKRIMKGMNLDEERYPPRQACWFIAANKEEGRRAKEVEAYDDVSNRFVEVYAAYDQQCQREGAVDFAELLLRSYELLSRNDLLREHYRNRFKHILVDEFQDTNRLQYRWLQLLAGGDNTIFAVGDDDQSIYAFRGANTANMQHLQRDFHVDRVIKLEQNYRSHAHILDAANALISHNRKRLGKNLWTAEGKGESLRVYEAGTDLDEASYIVQEVKGLRGDGVSLGEIALLYRSNAQSRVLEHALFNASLPYKVYGGLRFFERQEIKHALAYLRLVANAEDDGAFLRIVNFPTRGVGARSVEQIQDVARERGITLWAAACANTLSGKASSSIAGFVKLIENMRQATAGVPLPELIEHVVEASGLKQHYQSEKEGADRLENLAELTNAAASFIAERDVQPIAEGEEEADDLTAFLAHAALEAGEHQALAGADALQLMTVHSAKGLEFHSVFISGLEEGLFPHENSSTEAEGLEEERRLMYVALTRARRRLYLTYAQSRMLHGQTRFNVASRFFQEIPQQLMRKIKGVPRQAQPSYFGGRGYSGSVPVQPKVDMGNIESGLPWRIGQSVAHAKFGPGVIVSSEGRGADARVQINFRDSGLKWLMLEYANLEPA
ncbi:MAG: ATP-dependent helicase UvrD/PcrA [Betaproteobacteria bacterium]|jgi:DNA helicase-2/ATP-dependent DNA helicase PcrA|nr:ATP-dependent helicase UvrD/PcrA [Betaproteobacteria bacterium]